ncbi:hypothetical protein [Nevskia sp.]|uniref:hypothetical protein n=1 Tax=Nevskia sp. TaxID=1929292 RepID=UPI0025F2E922|nr:hypothetical protein [Nevskia sp.]
MFNQAFHATLQILLFRKGPEDFPYSADGRLNMACTALGIVATALMLGMLDPPLVALANALVATATVGFYARFLLRMRRLEARYQQTRNALLAVGSTLMLLMLIPAANVVPALPVMEKISQALATSNGVVDANGALPGLTPEQIAQVPRFHILAIYLLGLWFAASAAHILRGATGVPRIAAALMAILLISNVQVAMLIVGSLLLLIIG